MGYLYTPSFLGYVKVGMAWMQDKNQVFLPGGCIAGIRQIHLAWNDGWPWL